MIPVKTIVPGVGIKYSSRHECTNTTRHKWNSNGICAKCNIRKQSYKDGFKTVTIYFEKNGKRIGNRAPECKQLNQKVK